MEFIDYLKKGITPHHAVAAAEDILAGAGFTEFALNEPFKAVPGGKYYVKIYSTAIAAFNVGRNVKAGSPFHIAAAHTDHPCLHIKPVAEYDPHGNNGWMKLNCEIYGGPIYNTWLDRPLSVAGLVALRSSDPFKPELRLFDFKRPVAVIPNLAIHFNREINKGVALNQQTDMVPVLGMFNQKINEGNYLISTVAKELGVKADDILDCDLYVYCCDAPTFVGLESDMLSAPALDNLTSCYAITEGIASASPDDCIDVALLFDHEEIGSRTKTGADSAVMKTLLEKLSAGLGFAAETLNDSILSSFLFSVDVGHATHPNHPEKYDPVNKIGFGEGIALKMSSNQRYTLDPSAIATAEMLCKEAGTKYKKFMIRADIPGGSTIGPMLSSLLPMHTADIGVPILAMHSACELMQASDEDDLIRLMKRFYR